MALRQPEQQTLEQLYKPKMTRQSAGESLPDRKGLTLSGKAATFIQELQSRKEETDSSPGHITSSALKEGGQEREVTFKIKGILRATIRSSNLSERRRSYMTLEMNHT